MGNIAFTYMGISHVAAVPEQYPTEDAFKQFVIEKYARLTPHAAEQPGNGGAQPFVARPDPPEIPPGQLQMQPGPSPDDLNTGPVGLGQQPLYTVVQASGIGWYNVRGPQGLHSGKSMRRDEANALCARLNSGVGEPDHDPV